MMLYFSIFVGKKQNDRRNGPVRNKLFNPMMTRIVSLFVVFLSWACSAFGQEVTFTADVPRVVVVGEVFRVEFTLNKQPSDFKAPDFAGFDIVAGPTMAQGQNIVISGGQTVRQESFSYTYVLRASGEGNQTIGAASAVVDGKTYITKAVPVEVVRERSSGGNRGEAGAEGEREDASTLAKDDILLRMIANKTSVYKGEALLVQIKMYTRAGIAGVENVKEPAFNGFWKQEIRSDQPVQWERETFNGKVYETGIIRQFLLFPQKSGVLEIEQMDMTVVAQVQLRQTLTGNMLFDNMFGGPQLRNVRRKLQTVPLKINVRELPAGAPAAFNGAVGEFAFSGSLRDSQINANSSTSITVQISGRGNLPLIDAPNPGLPDSFELYTTKNDEKFTVTADGMQGYKSFEYPFIARAEGVYDIPGIPFAYFDPKEERYKTLTTDAFRLEVLRDVSGRAAGEAPVVAGVTKEELKILNDDIRFIRVGEPNLKPRNRFFVGSWGYVLTLVGLCALFAALLFYMQKRIRELRDTVKLRNRKANRKARQRLKAAYRYMTAAKEGAFYEEMLRALLGYVGDKLNIPVADLSKDNIREQLLRKGAAEGDVEELLQIVSDCEFAQYAPGKGVQMNNIYQSSLDLIGRFEAKL